MKYLILFLLLFCMACNRDSIKNKAQASSVKTNAANASYTRSEHEAQASDLTEISSLSAGLSHFIPEGFSPLDTASGDLNKDAFTDMILVLRNNAEDTSSEQLDRPMILLLGQQDGSWKKAAENDKVILCAGCGGVKGDPFREVVIKNGYFSAEFYGGAAQLWTRTVTFKYVDEEKNWFLHKDGSSSWYCCDDENRNEKETLKTAKDFGKVRFEDFDIYKD